MSTTKPFGRATAALLLGLTILLAALPLALARGAVFEGSDERARAAVVELAPGHQPWVNPLFTPPGSTVESLLFTLQAAIGAGLIGYYFGLKRGQHQVARAGEQEREARAATESQGSHGHD